MRHHRTIHRHVPSREATVGDGSWGGSSGHTFGRISDFTQRPQSHWAAFSQGLSMAGRLVMALPSHCCRNLLLGNFSLRTPSWLAWLKLSALTLPRVFPPNPPFSPIPCMRRGWYKESTLGASASFLPGCSPQQVSCPSNPILSSLSKRPNLTLRVF